MRQLKRALPVFAITLALGLPGLLFAQAQGRIAGQVVDPDGNPVEGVEITVSAQEVQLEVTQTSNKKGKFTIALVDSTKTYIIRLVKEGYATLEEPVDPPAGGILRNTWVLRPGGDEPTSDALAPTELTGARAAVRAYNEGAEAYNAGDMAGAIAKFEEAAAQDPEMPETYIVLGRLYLDQKDHQQALTAAERLLALEPENPHGLTIKYDALLAAGREGEADAVLETLVAVDSSGETAVRVFNQGVRAVRANQADEAIQRFEQALAMDPSLTEAHGALGDLYVVKKDYPKALEHGQALLELEPGSIRGLSVVYDAYLGMGDQAKAQEAFDALKAADPQAVVRAFFKQGEQLFNAGQGAAAIDAFEKVLAADPDHARAHYEIGLALASVERTEEAKGHLERFIELAPDDPDAATAREMLQYLK